MIHEFFGLPGSGKSYIAHRISQSKGVLDIAIASTAERLGRAILFALSHPFFFTRLMTLFLRENYKNPKLLKHKFATIVLEVAAREQKSKNKTMIESGFFQLLLSLYEREIKEKDITPLLRWLKKRPYMVYVVEADRAVREERIHKRGRIPRGGVITDPRKLAEWFGLLERNFEVIKQCIVKDFSHEIIRNN